MKIVRIVDKTGRMTHASVEKDGYRVIKGSIFGEYATTEEVIAPGRAKLLSPVEPPQVIAIGLNYRKHAQESNMAEPAAPRPTRRLRRRSRTPAAEAGADLLRDMMPLPRMPGTSGI